MKMRNLIIVGDSSFAEVAYEYFTHDSEYRVAAFAVEREYLQRSVLFGLPVVALDELALKYTPDDHDVFVAVVYSQLNRLRARLYENVKRMGYNCARYISTRAFVWPNARLGEHCFVFEGNVIQPFVEIGNDVILWSGNHIGHHSLIEDHCFIASHAVISGHCHIGKYCFLGVNSTLGNNVTLGADTVVGAAALILKSAEGGHIYASNATGASKVTARHYYKLDKGGGESAVREEDYGAEGGPRTNSTHDD